jgi:8-oxo-dGTP pyrophosphatase MutT (NUDIX family)
MRTIHRDIVGGFIFSSDGKILLGKNRSGGVYEGRLVVPGGGVESGETKLEALRREMIEETGIDISDATVTEINESSGEHGKTLQDTGERVFVKMNFYDYKVMLPQAASETKVKTDDDWAEPQWFMPSELKASNISPPTRNTLLKIGILAN